jgi:hypothetical protein
MHVPSARVARVAKASRPRSMPVSWPVGGSGWVGTSTQEMETYQPSASFVSVRERDRLGPAFKGAAPVDAEAPELRQDELAVLQPCPVAILLIR